MDRLYPRTLIKQEMRAKMKVRSIRTYVMHKQLKASLILIAVVFLFSIIVLFGTISFQAMGYAKENAEYLRLTVTRFLDEYTKQAQYLNRSQEIRSYLAYAKQTETALGMDEPALPNGVVLYDTEKQVCPGPRYPRHIPVRPDGGRPFIVAFSEVQLGYFVPFYNFTGSEVLGYLCFTISQPDFRQAVKRSTPNNVSFAIQDSYGNAFLDLRKNYRYQQELVVDMEDTGLTCTIKVDLEEEYRSLLLFTFSLVPVWLVMILVSILFSQSLSTRLIQPINSLITAIKQNEIGDLEYIHTYTSDLEEIDMLSQSYRSMLLRIRELIDMNQKQNLLRMESQIGMLQEKINPHFLFNTLELISSQAIMEDAEQTSILIQKLGTLFRYNLRAPDIIPLKRELQYVKDYLYLQNIRLNRLMEYEYETDESLLPVELPKLSIQPLLENCFKHGFASSSHQPHRIQLIIGARNGMLIIRVDDDGSGISEDRRKELDMALIEDQRNFSHFINRREHIGLRNVNARLCMNFRIPKALWFVDSRLGGTCIELRLPLESAAALNSS